LFESIPFNAALFKSTRFNAIPFNATLSSFRFRPVPAKFRRELTAINANFHETSTNFRQLSHAHQPLAEINQHLTARGPFPAVTLARTNLQDEHPTGLPPAAG